MRGFNMDNFDAMDLLTDTEKAESYVTCENVPWESIKKDCLRDKDVVIKYMEKHSSNDLLRGVTPIDITQEGFLSDGEFITKVIQNLDAGYSKDNLNKLLKLSAREIVKRMMRTMKYEDPEHYTEDVEFWKAKARMCMEDYANSVEDRNAELVKKVQILDEIMNYEIPGLDSKKSDNYKKCNIGFTAKF